MTVCPACGKETPEGFPRCAHCGAELAAPAPAREERKVVSVLFADLVGFTSKAERLDPEDVRATLSPYYARLREELERHGGTVEKFIGDAVMALFGAPVAHEDDPERAVRAALAIRDWVRDEEQLQVRIAVNTGEALISLGARPVEGEGMAAGDVVNSAARLQSAAPVNGILVGERTYRATQHAIDYRELEPVVAKGKEEPLPVWEAVEARSRFGLDVPHEARTPLVGRERELEILRAAFGRVRDEHAPQLVTLVGVPGVGKSRLLYELSSDVETDPELIYWRQGRSLPYGEGLSFWALAEMVKAHAGILDTDDENAAEEKLATAVSGLVPEQEADWVRGHLAGLAGVGEESQVERGEAFAAWRRFFEALAEQRPLVLVFEDLHWADEGLLDFVDHLVDWASGVPVFVLATARPELLDRRPGWGGGKHNATTLSLSALSEDDTARLIGSLLGSPVIEAGHQAELVERVGGNPLYAEQYVQMLGERAEGEDLPLPESIQGIVGARVDALSAQEKQLLQDAAVIGKVFWPGAAATLAGSSEPLDALLHSLVRKQFIRRDRRSSVADETQYAFLHLLLRDVAYSQIPRAARAEKHVRAASWIEGLGRVDDHIEMLAHHYVTALETTRAAGQDSAEIIESARTALERAGDRARSLHSYGTAAQLYRQALELWPEEASEERANLMFGLARASFDGDEEGREEAVKGAREAMLAVGDAARAAELETLLGQVAWMAGDTERCMAHLARAEELVGDLPPSPGKARVLSQAARFRALGGEDVETDARNALALAEQLGLDELRANILVTIAHMRADAGDPAAREYAEEALRIAPAEAFPVRIRALSSLASIADWSGDLQEANRFAETADELARRFAGVASARWTRGNVITIYFHIGEWDRLARETDDFLAQSAALGPHYHDAQVRLSRALLRCARGDDAGALADASEALARARGVRDPQQYRPALGTSAYLFAELGRLDEASALLDEAMTWEETFGYLVEQLEWAADLLGRRSELAALLPSSDRPRFRALRTAFEGRFADAAAEYDAIGAVASAAYARLRAGDEHLEPALEFFRSVGAKRYVERGEALLARSA